MISKSLQLSIFVAVIVLLGALSSRADLLADAASLSPHCQRGSGCSPNVALLITEFGENDIASCTAFVDRDGLVHTAAHCLPAHQRGAGAGCSNVVAIFPSFGRLAVERIRCARVEDVTYEGGTSVYQADHAVLRLEQRPRRQGFQISPGGIDFDVALTRISARVPWYQDLYSGEYVAEFTQTQIQAERCMAAHDPVTLPEFTNRFSPLALLAGCAGDEGDSGSPVIASDGTVRGIVTGRFPVLGITQWIVTNFGRAR